MAVGPENHFNKLFSIVDCVMVFSGFVLQFVEIPSHGDALIRMIRVYNASFLV